MGTSAWAEDSYEEELEVYGKGHSVPEAPGSVKSEGLVTIDLTPPVKHMFIHCNNTVSLTRCNSALGALTKTRFRRKYNPEMQERHTRGERRPCAYSVHKEDGCRWGTKCQFCHLCPAEAVKRRMKEKVKAFKAEAAALQMQRYRSHRNSRWKWSGNWQHGRRYWVK